MISPEKEGGRKHRMRKAEKEEEKESRADH
jgi:hypothetical protein